MERAVLYDPVRTDHWLVTEVAGLHSLPPVNWRVGWDSVTCTTSCLPGSCFVPGGRIIVAVLEITVAIRVRTLQRLLVEHRLRHDSRLTAVIETGSRSVCFGSSNPRESYQGGLSTEGVNARTGRLRYDVAGGTGHGGQVAVTRQVALMSTDPWVRCTRVAG